MGREWLFKENPFDLIRKIENAVYTCGPAQADGPVADAGASSLSVLLPFIWHGNHAALTWLAWSATGWFLWSISGSPPVLKRPDCSYRIKMETNLSSVLFFFYSKWLKKCIRVRAQSSQKFTILFKLQLILSFLLVFCISSLLVFYIFLSSHLSFISCCWWIDWIEEVFGGAFKALESRGNDPTGFDSMSASVQSI